MIDGKQRYQYLKFVFQFVPSVNLSKSERTNHEQNAQIQKGGYPARIACTFVKNEGGIYCKEITSVECGRPVSPSVNQHFDANNQ